MRFRISGVTLYVRGGPTSPHFTAAPQFATHHCPTPPHQPSPNLTSPTPRHPSSSHRRTLPRPAPPQLTAPPGNWSPLSSEDTSLQEGKTSFPLLTTPEGRKKWIVFRQLVAAVLTPYAQPKVAMGRKVREPLSLPETHPRLEERDSSRRPGNPLHQPPTS